MIDLSEKLHAGLRLSPRPVAISVEWMATPNPPMENPHSSRNCQDSSIEVRVTTTQRHNYTRTVKTVKCTVCRQVLAKSIKIVNKFNPPQHLPAGPISEV